MFGADSLKQSLLNTYLLNLKGVMFGADRLKQSSLNTCLLKLLRRGVLC